MFDTMTFTKTMGALCGALLIFLLGKWAAEELYHTDGPHSAREQAYVIDTGADADTDVGDVAEVDFSLLLAEADPSRGERLWRQCAACHSLEDGRNGTGPHLYGIVGRGKGDVEGYGFSDVFADNPDIWTPENLNAFLENPRGYAPGTKMAYAGMRAVEDRAALIAYLDTVDE
ncbi:c-type cytochrome [Plastorhodobacter daqingensis]|uniref:C-type cytochrome n=1 Tax=Plastorhodobacter daqingensis TaxID=1387281 RepID=A0ABW2UP72_9RHOB